jgi:vitamin B12 transporter
VRQVPYTVQVLQWSYQYHSKKSRKKAIAGTAYMNIGTQTTARTNYRQDYNQGLSVNGNLDKFVYASLNSTETTGISEAACTNCV